MNLNERTCPECGKKLIYSNKAERNRAEKNKRKCRDHQSGENNPFFGKKHSKETKNKLRELHIGKKHSEETKILIGKISSGRKCSMSGKTLFEFYSKKFGKEIAIEIVKKRKEKSSLSSSGKNNPMYGKPSPTGSGNGWSGWYKGWYFRSIRELTYMICVIERFKFKWENGETKKYKIQYVDWEGKTRNYFPDFIIDEKYMVECKPKKLHNSSNVLAKKKAAELFCKSNDLKYKMVDPGFLSTEKMIELYDSRDIKFLPRYEEKFLKEYYNK